MVFSEYGLTIDVTADDVKNALGRADTSAFSDTAIEQKISEEELIVYAHLPDDLNTLKIPEDHWTEGIEMLVRRRAARNLWMSQPAAVRKQALDAVVSYDIQAFRGRLTDDVEEAYAILGIDMGGETSAFVDATGSSFRDRNKTQY